MDKKTIREMLNGATIDDFIEIIQKMSKTGSRAEEVILDWGKKHNEQYRARAVEIELENLWKKAESIISRFNSYGGGPESEENKAYNALEKMQELAKEQDLSWNFKKTIVDGLLYQFSRGNSGFDDFLIDTASEFCVAKEEKLYLADYLSNGHSGCYTDYAARIYLSLGFQERYLRVKLDNLCYISDYVEVANYYMEKGEKDKAWGYI